MNHSPDTKERGIAGCLAFYFAVSGIFPTFAIGYKINKDMKKILFLLICPLLLVGCSSDDDEDSGRVAVTQSEVQGSWLMTTGSSSSALTYNLSFSGSSYTLNVMDAKGNWTHRERGTYSISGYDLKADAEVYYSNTSSTRSMVDGDQIYWETSAKNVLHVYPLGSFYKSN